MRPRIWAEDVECGDSDVLCLSSTWERFLISLAVQKVISDRFKLKGILEEGCQGGGC